MMTPKIKHILYSTDLSENSVYAFNYASSLASHYQADITIFHVVEDLPSSAYTLLSGYLDEKQLEKIRKDNEEAVLSTIKTRLEAFCSESNVDCPNVNVVVKRGNPVEQILKMIKTDRFDMVVMGTHGHGLFEETMMGSTVRRVLRRSEKPVLVVRLPKEK